jgi:flagellar hook-length control protein FliK
MPVSGTPQGASQAAARKGFFGGRTDASSPTDGFEAFLGAQFAAMLQSGVPLAQIVERLANAPPGSTAAPQAAALARELATIAGRAAGEAATTTAGQQNDISGHVLDADTLAREHPAQHDTAAATASDSTSLPQEMLAQIAVALQLPQSPALAPTAPASQSTAANSQSDAPAPVQVAQAPSASPDLLMRMLARAASVQPQSPPPITSENDAATAPPAQAQAAQPPPAAAPSASPTVDVQLAQIVASTTQRASNDGSQGNADLLGGDASDRGIAKLLAAPAKTDGSSAAFGMPSFLSTLQHVSQNAQAPQTSPPPSFDAEEVIAQIVKSVSMRTTDAGSHVNLRLQPESLGDVSMKISVSGSQINAVVTAQNADVRDLLLASAQQLARSFAGAGLKLGSFSVNVSGGNAHGDARRNDGGSGARRRIVGAAVSDVAEPVGAPQYGIPIASATGLMNYFA